MRILQPILLFPVTNKLGSITTIEPQRFARANDIDILHSLVVLVTPLLEVRLHQVDKIFILTRVHSVIFHVYQAVFMQDFGHLFAVLLPASLAFQVTSHVD